MTHYMIACRDRAGAGAIRTANRDQHLAYLRSALPVDVRAAGPLLDADGAMVGSLLIVASDDRQAVSAFLEGDPYRSADLFESVEVSAWKPVIGPLAG